ncbi:MAG: flavodoxin [Eubacteriales bacterium]
MDKKERILVTAYSYAGATRDLAKIISRSTGGDFRAIMPSKPYPESYTEVLRKIDIEIRMKKERKLQSDIDISEYDTIFIGSPNWYGSIAPPVRTFLVNNDFTGKKVIPFATRGGGEANCLKEINELAAGAAEKLDGFDTSVRSVDEAEVKAWLKDIGYLKN